MASGVNVDDAVVHAFNQLKMGHYLRYAIFKISDDFSRIEVSSTAETATYDEFCASLPANDCRYGVYDFEYEVDGGKRNKIVLFVWAPDSAKIKNKMLYASSKDNLKKMMVGIGSEVQATDASEIDYQVVLEKVTRA